MNRFSLYLSGWVVITLAYVSTLYFVGNLYSWLSGLPLDHQRSLSGLVIGSAMATIPYMIGGLFIKTSGKDRAEIPAIWTSVVPAIGEKILIFLIGAFFVASGGDGSGDGVVTWSSVSQFVQAEALPYYTPTYLSTIPLSVLACVATVRLAAGRAQEKRP